ncbi:two component transcriptional regulator, LuxR family [Tissierella praeacuta DSM 18095]|uniref:Two component transcriptional regulator, LuxR family n=1 Tax=Tissierella praeacuta DSM 18095 TaxID=1123404 RepID=A0A1M4W1X6_9FIRM|nr:response regulator transcription factor [Tissierella praeacuta]TCU75667.1 LuxR family two component transcriptional regulator [Tissierella praeacuta]SHE75219.1 two component transcriptional regulator, LuxR family [Tissierella praeacuta DSM 18095]SUP00193.1 Response regulator protein vraR [Tissierella praeacuta]
MIKVLIVDDQSLIREGLNMMLSLYDTIFIVDEATNGKEAIEILGREEIDLILMDIRMPVMDGVEATKQIKENYPNTKVLILTTFNEDEYIFEGLKSGADGYLLKDISSKELVKAIETVYRGNTLLQSDVAKKMIKSIGDKVNIQDSVDNTIFKELTKKEYEIALLIGEGKSNKEIGKILYIAEGTVKNHITKILSKLELRDRTQLAVLIKEYSKI